MIKMHESGCGIGTNMKKETIGRNWKPRNITTTKVGRYISAEMVCFSTHGTGTTEFYLDIKGELGKLVHQNIKLMLFKRFC